MRRGASRSMEHTGDPFILDRPTSVDETISALRRVIELGVSAPAEPRHAPSAPQHPVDDRPGFHPIRGWVRGTHVRIDASPYTGQPLVVARGAILTHVPILQLDAEVQPGPDGTSRIVGVVSAPANTLELPAAIAFIGLVAGVLLLADTSAASVAAVALIAVGVLVAILAYGWRRRRAVTGYERSLRDFLVAALDAEREGLLPATWPTRPTTGPMRPTTTESDVEGPTPP